MSKRGFGAAFVAVVNFYTNESKYGTPGAAGQPATIDLRAGYVDGKLSRSCPRFDIPTLTRDQ